MFIEFTGVPCSGKSTISHRIVEELCEKGYIVEEIPYVLSHNMSRFRRVILKSIYFIRFLIVHPLKFWRTISLQKVDFKLKFNLCYIQGIYSINVNKIYIFDQGIGQGILSLFEEKFCKINDLEQIINKIGIYDYVIWQVIVRTSTDTIEKRAKQRKAATYFTHSSKRRELIDRDINNIDIFEKCWTSMFGNERLISVNGEDELNSITKEILLQVRLK